MNKTLIPYYAIFILVGYIVFLKACDSRKCPVSTAQVTVKHDTLITSVHDTVPIYDPQPDFVETQWDTAFITKPVDTVGIINDYMSKRAYRDTIRNQYGLVYLVDTIYQNKIADRAVTFDFKIPTITTTTAIPPKNQVFGGFVLGGGSNFLSFGPELILKTKNERIYNFSASFTSQTGMFYQVGAAWKIHF